METSLVLLRRVALHVPVGTHDHEGAVFVLVHGAVGEHLADDVVCSSCIGVVLLHLLDLPLEHIELCKFGLNCKLLLFSSRLLVGDLLFGASSLAARLQQVC